MTGARALWKQSWQYDVDVCFANPGTPEMHFVAALDEVPKMRGALAASGWLDPFDRIDDVANVLRAHGVAR